MSAERHKKDDDYDPDDDGDHHDPFKPHDVPFKMSEIIPDPVKLYAELKDMVSDKERGPTFIFLSIFVFIWSFWVLQFEDYEPPSAPLAPSMPPSTSPTLSPANSP